MRVVGVSNAIEVAVDRAQNRSRTVPYDDIKKIQMLPLTDDEGRALSSADSYDRDKLLKADIAFKDGASKSGVFLAPHYLRYECTHEGGVVSRTTVKSISFITPIGDDPTRLTPGAEPTSLTTVGPAPKAETATVPTVVTPSAVEDTPTHGAEHTSTSGPTADATEPVPSPPTTLAPSVDLSVLLDKLPSELRPVARLVVEDPAPSVRCSSAQILGASGDKSALAVLEPLVLKDTWVLPERGKSVYEVGADPGWSGRSDALEAIRKLDPQESTPALIKALKSPTEDVRAWACSELAREHDAKAGEALIGQVKDSSPRVRVAALKALAERKDSSARDAITQALKDADPSVRSAAVAALGRLATGKTQ